MEDEEDEVADLFFLTPKRIDTASLPVLVASEGHLQRHVLGFVLHLTELELALQICLLSLKLLRLLEK